MRYERLRVKQLHFGSAELNQKPAQLLTGIGAPATTAGTETGDAPNGSIYVNVTGAAGATVYAKSAGVWAAL